MGFTNHLGNSFGINLAFVGAAFLVTGYKLLPTAALLALLPVMWLLPPRTEIEMLSVQLLGLAALFMRLGKSLQAGLMVLSWVFLVVDAYDVLCWATWGCGTHFTHLTLNLVMTDIAGLLKTFDLFRRGVRSGWGMLRGRLHSRLLVVSVLPQLRGHWSHRNLDELQCKRG